MSALVLSGENGGECFRLIASRALSTVLSKTSTQKLERLR